MTETSNQDIKERIRTAWDQVESAKAQGDDVSASRYWREFVALIESQMRRTAATGEEPASDESAPPLARAS